ncbi:hypothetical protein HMPREF0185_03501 [Brevundimonas diminuta 470-4]|nr:hypothetical protein HMPREF0185_03501 [Brevundimonas diminuta 470-4]
MYVVHARLRSCLFYRRRAPGPPLHAAAKTPPRLKAQADGMSRLHSRPTETPGARKWRAERAVAACSRKP